MVNTKTLVIGALLAAMASLFQSIPVFTSEMFALLTVFSAVPVYIVSRINPKAGVFSYFTAAMIVLLISVHEGLIFLCTNGIVGVSLGICSYYTNKRVVIWPVCSLALTIALTIMNYGIGIPVFGTKIPGGAVIQLAILFIFSVIYNIIYFYFSVSIFKYLKRHLSSLL